ncbi:MAG: response regulator [Planctomycetota bacterium]
MKILIADDVGLIRRQLQHHLAATEHEVFVAEDGFRALALLRSNQTIDVVITDLLMPGMNGVELFAESRKIERLTDDGTDAGPDFMLLTGVRPTSRDARETEFLQQAASIGFFKILGKPVGRDDLLQAVAEVEEHRKTPKGDAEPDAAELERLLKGLLATYGRERVSHAIDTLPA